MPAVQVDKKALLAGHFLLGQLDGAALERIATSAVLARHPPHSTIFEKGDPGLGMMAVIRGRVKICTYSIGGKELVLNIIDRGGLFGEIALLDGRPRTAHAVTLEETDLLVLERNRFLPILTANPEIGVRLIAVLCDRLRQTSEHLEDALFLEAGPRLRPLAPAARRLVRPGHARGRAAEHQAVAAADRQSRRHLAGKHQQAYGRLAARRPHRRRQRLHHHPRSRGA